MSVATSADPFADWPDLLRELAQAIGAERALELARRFGGQDYVYVPEDAAKTRTTHAWCQVLTGDEWDAVVGLWGGSRITLPRGTFASGSKRRILELLEQGVAKRQIAVRVGVTQRHVRRVAQLAGLSKPRSGRRDAQSAGLSKGAAKR